jgi:subtilisin family serine protease
MSQLKVVVPLLNKRTAPVENTDDVRNVVGQVNDKFQFESVEEKENSLGTWFKDRDGNWYWGGGLADILSIVLPGNKIIPLGKQLFDPDKMSWGHKFYDIPFIWDDLKTKGRGVIVAVIDTGIDDKHPDLVSNIHPLSKSFFADEKDISDIDGHGTQMAGIITASGNSKVFGVAPESKILIVKAAQQVRGADVKLFAKALNHAAGIKEIDIISISNCFFINDPDLQVAVKNCISNNKIIVAAIGNGRDFIGKPNGPDDDTYPACFTDVIAIGAFDEQGQICSFSNWNAHVSFLSPGDFSILTTGLNNSSTKGAGTSIATAFTAGCLALLLSYAKANSILPSKCIQAILDSCDDIGGAIGKDIQSGNGRMNLRNAITKLK